MVCTDRFLSKYFFRKSLLSFIICCLVWLAGNSQDKPPVQFGKVSKEDFHIQSPLVDSNANAVVVFDKGDISFEGNATGWFMYVLKRSCRILVVNKNGFDAATVQLMLYQNNDSKEKVDNLSATTYNLENGSVIETKLNSRDVFEEKEDNNHFYKKFTMPAVKEGSIIEYSYSIKSDFTFNLPAWEFQSTAYPVLWSECNVTIPSLLAYMTFLQGYHKFSIDKSADGFKNYSISRQKDLGILTGVDERLNVSAATIIHRWVMKDLPSFKGENFMATPLNFIDKISFQLYQTYDGENYHNVANTWKKATEELMEREDFGKPLTEDNSWLDALIAPLINQGDNELAITKKIYLYVQKNYTCTNEYNKFIKTTLKEVVKKRSGTIGDINLLLIAMLKHQNIAAIPVLLSTREVGRVPKNYPMMERLNYVVGKVNINQVDYYLDASVPYLPFGKLPLKCYNGPARIISKDSAVVNLEADSIKEAKFVIMFLNNSTSGDLLGGYIHKAGFFESLDIRNTITKSSLDAFKKKFLEKFPEKFQLNNIEVDSLQFPEAELTISSDISLKIFKEDDIVYFNPMMSEAIIKNPFYSLKRLYPVEMPYKTDDIFTLNMEIPKGYKIDELPKSVRMNLNENEGMFEYLITADANVIQMKCRVVLRKAIFSSEDYDSLRDFYAFIVKKEAEQIVFKKIK